MSGMDRLSYDKLKRMADGLFNALEMQLLDDLGSMARELLAHRRASQAAPAEEWEACTCGPCPLHPAAPAPSDGLREAAERLERAEDSAWNDAIEAAEAAYAHGFAAIRALRRAAPTEEEA